MWGPIVVQRQLVKTHPSLETRDHHERLFGLATGVIFPSQLFRSVGICIHCSPIRTCTHVFNLATVLCYLISFPDFFICTVDQVRFVVHKNESPEGAGCSGLWQVLFSYWMDNVIGCTWHISPHLYIPVESESGGSHNSIKTFEFLNWKSVLVI